MEVSSGSVSSGTLSSSDARGLYIFAVAWLNSPIILVGYPHPGCVQAGGGEVAAWRVSVRRAAEHSKQDYMRVLRRG